MDVLTRNSERERAGAWRGGRETRREIVADGVCIDRVYLERDAIVDVAAQVQLHPPTVLTEVNAGDLDAPLFIRGRHRTAVEAEKKFVER